MIVNKNNQQFLVANTASFNFARIKYNNRKN